MCTTIYDNKCSTSYRTVCEDEGYGGSNGMYGNGKKGSGKSRKKRFSLDPFSSAASAAGYGQPLSVPAEGYGHQPSLRCQSQPKGDGLRQDVQTVRCQRLNSVT